jgi:hypothetical protein
MAATLKSEKLGYKALCFLLQAQSSRSRLCQICCLPYRAGHGAEDESNKRSSKRISLFAFAEDIQVF